MLKDPRWEGKTIGSIQTNGTFRQLVAWQRWNGIDCLLGIPFQKFAWSWFVGHMYKRLWTTIYHFNLVKTTTDSRHLATTSPTPEESESCFSHGEVIAVLSHRRTYGNSFFKSQSSAVIALCSVKRTTEYSVESGKPSNRRYTCKSFNNGTNTPMSYVTHA